MTEEDDKLDNFNTVVSSYYVDASRMLEWHFKDMLNKIYRRISLRHTCKNAWSIEVKAIIHRDIFTALYAGLETFHPKLGFSIEESWYKSKQQLKSVTFTFTLLGIFVYHLNNICNQSVVIPTKLRKKFKCGSFGEIMVSTLKPVLMKYNSSVVVLVK